LSIWLSLVAAPLAEVSRVVVLLAAVVLAVFLLLLVMP